jgi:hypothetical protein
MGWQMVRHSEMDCLFTGDRKIELNSTPAKHSRDSGVMAGKRSFRATALLSFNFPVAA